MQRLEVSGVVRPTYGSLGVKRLTMSVKVMQCPFPLYWVGRHCPSHMVVLSGHYREIYFCIIW